MNYERSKNVVIHKLPNKSQNSCTIKVSKEDQQIERPIHRILKKRSSNGKCEYLVLWLNGRQQWLPKDHLRCPKLLERFEKLSRQRDIINHYNDKTAVKKSEKYGFQRNLAVEKFVGGMLLEGIPVLEVKWKSVDEHDLVLWEEAVEKHPQKVLDFYLTFLLFKQSQVVHKWGEFSDLPKLPKEF